MIPLEFVTPTLDYLLLAPVLIAFGAACLGILFEAFLPRQARFAAQVVLSVLALLVAIVMMIWRWGIIGQGLVDPWMEDVVNGSVLVDGATQVFWLILFSFALISVIFFAERSLHKGATAFTASAATPVTSGEPDQPEPAKSVHSEVFPLALFSLVGMAVLVAANDLLIMFVGLEVMSLPLYVLVGLARHRRLASQEASLKYFLMGAAASAILLFGVGFLFGFSGGFSYNGLAHAVGFVIGADPLMLTGMALVGVGLLFKIGAVPFHMWVPDVYQGAPTPVSAFMSVGTKVAAVGAMLRLFFVGFGGMRWTWQPVLAGVAILTILVGAIIAINQSNVKRLLGYSAVVHAGFILIPMVGAFTLQTGLPQSDVGSLASIMFYLIAYGFATIGAFAIVSLVYSAGGEDNSMKAWAGLGKRRPLMAIFMLIFLLSLAGIPLTAGFIAKYAILATAWRGGFWWLALAGIVGAIIAVYIYFRLIQVMFLKDPIDDIPVEVVAPGAPTWIVLGICLAGTLVLGLAPGPLLELLSSAASFVFPASSG